MSCNYNGAAMLNTIILVPQATASATSLTYAVDITKYLCKGTCLNPYVAPSSVATINVLDITSLGNDTYSVDIAINGSLVYQPYCGCNCPNLKREEWSVRTSIAVSSTTEPTITFTLATPVVSIINPTMCGCNYSKAVDIQLSFVATLATATQAASSTTGNAVLMEAKKK